MLQLFSTLKIQNSLKAVQSNNPFFSPFSQKSQNIFSIDPLLEASHIYAILKPINGIQSFFSLEYSTKYHYKMDPKCFYSRMKTYSTKKRHNEFIYLFLFLLKTNTVHTSTVHCSGIQGIRIAIFEALFFFPPLHNTAIQCKVQRK